MIRPTLSARGAARLSVVLTLVAIIGTGCGGPALELRFEVPAPYRAQVARVVLEVLVPPAGRPFDCEDLAFGRVDAALRTLSRSASYVVTDESRAELSALPRTGRKLFVAEGRDDEDVQLVAGCAEVRDIEVRQSVAIEGAPVPRVADLTPREIAWTGAPGGEVAASFSAVDVWGRPIASLPFLVTLAGGGWPEDARLGQTDASGVGGFEVPQPEVGGPFLAELRLPWLPTAPPQIPGMWLPTPTTHRMEGSLVDAFAGAFGAASDPGVAVVRLHQSGVSFSLLGEILRFQADGSTVAESFPLPLDTEAVGLVPGTDGDALVAAVGQAGGAGARWVRIEDGVRTEFRPGGGFDQLRGPIVAAGSCLETTGEMLVSSGDGRIGVHDREGRLREILPLEGEMLAGGCVREASGRLLRTIIVNGGAGVGLYVAAEIGPGLWRETPWIAFSFGVAFAPEVGGEGPLLLGTQLRLDAFVLSRLSLSLAPDDTLSLLREGQAEPPALPAAMLGGDLTGDGALDVVATYRDLARGRDAYGLWMVSGARFGAGRISGYAALDDFGPWTAPMPLRLPHMPSDDLVIADEVPGDGIRLYRFSFATGAPR